MKSYCSGSRNQLTRSLCESRCNESGACGEVAWPIRLLTEDKNLNIISNKYFKRLLFTPYFKRLTFTLFEEFKLNDSWNGLEYVSGSPSMVLGDIFPTALKIRCYTQQLKLSSIRTCSFLSKLVPLPLG